MPAKARPVSLGHFAGTCSHPPAPAAAGIAFLGPLGIPCQAPPWGTIAGVDLKTGEIAYQKRNGTVYDMTPLPLPFKVGVPGIGGPMITKGGVVFLGAAVDNYLRAYDLTTGDQLWESRLPAGGQATGRRIGARVWCCLRQPDPRAFSARGDWSPPRHTP